MPLPGRRTRRERADIVALVRELGGLLAELGLSEVEVERAGLRVRVQKGAPATGAPLPAASPALLAAPVAAPVAAPSDVPAATHEVIEAPMVGTFYRASSPTAEPYVREGDSVKQGLILCIIEAMKLMNEIEAKLSGRIVKILVENATPVEYGQPLFHIDPNG
jgi:acetyl-CoA carboxylase biotin carboxyl carrier protein